MPIVYTAKVIDVKTLESGTNVYDVKFTEGFFLGDVERGLNRSAIRVEGDLQSEEELKSAAEKERARLEEEQARAIAKAKAAAAKAEAEAQAAARAAAEAAAKAFSELGGRNLKPNRFIKVQTYDEAQTITVDIEPTDTVADMKRKAAPKLRTNIRHQILTFEGQELVVTASQSTHKSATSQSH